MATFEMRHGCGTRSAIVRRQEDLPLCPANVSNGRVSTKWRPPDYRTQADLRGVIGSTRQWRVGACECYFEFEGRRT
jgi:hypothetical protein